MLLLNIEYIPGKKIEALGIAKGSVVQSKNFGKDFMAGMKTLVGGEIESYTQMLTEARQIATKRMVARLSWARSNWMMCRRTPSVRVRVPCCILRISSRGTSSFRSSLIFRRASTSASP